MVHVVNFTVWSLIFVASNVAIQRLDRIDTYGSPKDENLNWLKHAFATQLVIFLQIVAETNMNFFIIYLIAQFSRNHKVNDGLLGR